MMIMHPLFDEPIELKECTANVLVIENKSVFVKFIEELLAQKETGEGEFVLSENFKIQAISKNIEVVKDYFSINPNTRKVLNSIYNDVEKKAYSSENYLDTNNIIDSINVYMNMILEEYDTELFFNDRVDVSSLLKCLDVKVALEGNLLSKLVEYIDILKEYCNIKCFVFVNLKSFFSDDEICSIYKHVFYKKVNILLIESSVSKNKLHDEKIFIIDEDLCCIY